MFSHKVIKVNFRDSMPIPVEKKILHFFFFFMWLETVGAA